MIRVLLVDDQQLFLESLKIVIETSSNDIRIVATATNGIDALGILAEHEVDIVLLDVQMPELDGVATAREIRVSYPKTKIVMLTTFDDDQYVFEAIRNGASGYLLKDIGAEELVTSIIAVYQGTAPISPQLLEKLVRSSTSSGGAFIDSGEDTANYDDEKTEAIVARIREELTRQEKRITRLIGEGMDNFDIAEALHLAPQTVKNYVSSIYYKLCTHKRGQIARAARKYFHDTSG